MERLFSPCTRLRDRFRNEGLGPPDELQELNLDVSTEEFLSTERAFTFADLYAMLRNEVTIAWLTPHAAVAREHDGRGLDKRFGFDVDDNEIAVLARSPRHFPEVCDVVVRLLVASVVHSVTLSKWGPFDDIGFINAPTLTDLMEHCQSLKRLSLVRLPLDANYCRGLGAYSRPDLEIDLSNVSLRLLEQALWQRSLDAIRARPGLILVIFTLSLSRMGCAEISIWKASVHTFPGL